MIKVHDIVEYHIEDTERFFGTEKMYYFVKRDFQFNQLMDVFAGYGTGTLYEVEDRIGNKPENCGRIFIYTGKILFQVFKGTRLERVIEEYNKARSSAGNEAIAEAVSS